MIETCYGAKWPSQRLFPCIGFIQERWWILIPEPPTEDTAEHSVRNQYHCKRVSLPTRIGKLLSKEGIVVVGFPELFGLKVLAESLGE
jgi:hypothetical protein